MSRIIEKFDSSNILVEEVSTGEQQGFSIKYSDIFTLWFPAEHDYFEMTYFNLNYKTEDVESLVNETLEFIMQNPFGIGEKNV